MKPALIAINLLLVLTLVACGDTDESDDFPANTPSSNMDEEAVSHENDDNAAQDPNEDLDMSWGCLAPEGDLLSIECGDLSALEPEGYLGIIVTDARGDGFPLFLDAASVTRTSMDEDIEQFASTIEFFSAEPDTSTNALGMPDAGCQVESAVMLDAKISEMSATIALGFGQDDDSMFRSGDTITLYILNDETCPEQSAMFGSPQATVELIGDNGTMVRAKKLAKPNTWEIP